jgi:hypothetical protein
MKKKYFSAIFTCILALSYTGSANAEAELTPQYSMFTICDIMPICKREPM